MRHRKAGKKLGRNASHRRSLYRNLALALFRHERIITTLPKAKAVRSYIERLITLAKKSVGASREKALHYRRLVRSRLGPTSTAEVTPGSGDAADHRSILKKLFEEIAPRFAERNGGYTRIIKRHERRLGDAGQTAYLELLKEGETRVKRKTTAPAPRVEDESATQPTETSAEQPAEQPADVSASSTDTPTEEKKD